MELFKILGRIAVEGAKESTKVLEGVGNVAVKVGKAMAAGLAAGTAAVAALTKQAVESYAEFEQLAGGAAKIFDQMSQTKILNDAQNAYKELGLSANEYLAVMNDVGATFAATMGDEAGYEAAKTGLKAISDYASGTGKNVNELSQKFTLITRSTASYQSIADQFSGILPATSADFLKQAQAAGILSKSYKQLTEVPIDEYQAAVAQMLEQGVEGLGLTNNTVNEAFSTISGSLAMTKAAWKNLLTGFADKDQDVGQLISNLVESASAALWNLVPIIKQTLIGIGTMVGELAPIIGEQLPILVGTILPVLLTAAVNLLTTLFDSLPGLINSLLPVVVSAGLDVLFAFLTTIRDNFGMLFQTALDAIMQLVDGLLAPGSIELLLETASVVLGEIVWGLIDALPKLMESAMALIMRLVDYITDPSVLTELLRATLQILKEIAYGLVEAIPQLVKSAVTIVNSLYEFLLKPENIAMLLSAALEIIIALAAGLISSIPAMIEATVEMVKSIINTIIETDWGKIGGDVIDGLKRGISEAWEGLKSWFNGLWDSLFGGRSVDVSANGSSYNGKVNGSHASGLDYVPYDGYIAELHRGEMVVPASEARMLRGETKTADSSNVESLLTMILSAVQEGNMREPVLKFKEREVARMVREYA